MRKSDRILARIVLMFLLFGSLMLTKQYHRLASPVLGSYSELTLILSLVVLMILGISYINRDNLAWGKRYLKKGNFDRAIREFGIGVENEHVGSIVGLGDMNLYGYGCRPDPNYALALYAYAFDCMAKHETDKLGWSFYMGTPYLAAKADSGDISRNRDRLRNMAANLEHAADLSDPKVKELLYRIHGKLGNTFLARKYAAE